MTAGTETSVVSSIARPGSESRIPVLDGLRGVAILLVLWGHLMPDIVIPMRPLEWLRKTYTGGWIGVELFFVLSGFLITGILLDSKGARRYFWNFYMRRTLRIFPLYYASLALMFVGLPALGYIHGNDAVQMKQASPWFWTYCANIGWWLEVPPRTSWPTGLFDLRHFWSLSVEEHFYLAWPLVVSLTSLRSLKWVCALCLTISLLVRLFAAFEWGGDSVALHQTPCRFDGLAVGSCLAVIYRDGTWKSILPWAKWAAGFLAVPLVVSFFAKRGLWDGDRFLATAGVTLLAIIFGAFLMLALEPPQGGWAGSFLSGGALRFFGKYSYGLYVIHGSIGNVLDRFLPLDWWHAHIGWPVLTIIVVILYKGGVSLLLALISWHCFEKQFLKLKRYFVSGLRRNSFTRSQTSP